MYEACWTHDILLQYLKALGNRKKPNQNNKQFWRTNHQIRADKVRVLDAKGKQIGVMSASEALNEAKDAELDLVEIAPKAKPPVVKIIDFGKFKYREEKKLKKSKKGTKGTEVKEVRFSPFMGEADYQTRKKRVNTFLKEGNKVRPVVKFKGRQMGSKQFGYEILERLIEDIEHTIVIDMKPKFLGRHLAMVVSPSNKKVDTKPTITKNYEKQTENKKDTD